MEDILTLFNLLSISTVTSQSTQGSVIETPYFSPSFPSAGMSCLPALRCDLIITPVIFQSPLVSCLQMSSTTFGWLLWFFRELRSKFVCILNTSNKGQHEWQRTTAINHDRSMHLGVLIFEQYSSFINILGTIIWTIGGTI